MNNNQIFDRKLLKHNLDRFGKNFAGCGFLFREVAENLLENISYFNDDFADILEIGAKTSHIKEGIFKIKKPRSFIQSTSSASLNIDSDLLMDDEFLCFKEKSFDLVINNLNLHFVNDVLGSLIQTRQLLKDKGVFIGCFFGGTSLKELREVFSKIELEIYGGISPRVIPFIDVKNAGALAQKAGFKNVISDAQIIEISYSSLLQLLHDLRNMALSNILFDRGRKPLTKKMIFLMEKLIKEAYPDGENGFLIKFEIITITAFNH